MPGPADLLAQIQSRKGPPGLAAALAQQTSPLSSTSSEDAPKVVSSKQFKTHETPFEYAEDIQAFLLLSKDDKPTTLVPVLEEDVVVIPLAPCVYRMTDYTLAKQEPILLQRCILKLNVLRCLVCESQTLNTLLQHRFEVKDTIEEDELGKVRFMELLSNAGVYQNVSERILQRSAQLKRVQVRVDGLEAFLEKIESLTPSLQQARDEIATTESVSFFPGLGELFSPGSQLLAFPAGMEGSPVGCRCVQSWYAEEWNPATHTMKRRFVLVLEFCISVGTELVFVAATDVYPEFHDPTRNVPVKDLTHRKLQPQLHADDAQLLERLQQRGEFYASVATDNHYLEYSPDSFFPILTSGWNSNAVRPLSKGGRVMVDVKRGILEGHLPVRGNDGMSDTVKEAIKLFEQSKRTGVAVPFRTAILPEFTVSIRKQHRNDSDRQHLWQAWPMLTGFSFTARVWGKLLLGMPKPVRVVGKQAAMTAMRRPSTRRMGVEQAALGGEGSCGNCGYIRFQEQAFEQLVLAADKKELIRAVARKAGGGKKTEIDHVGDNDDDDSDDEEEAGLDVVANKGGASIFLLHGPPGCGKTLTAEAIAELLKKPLYIVTAGDLGITAAEVEKTLGAVLDLCQTWDALVLIDEADIFLEARNSTEIQRNALVCVMLRLLEYYSGCLFLSSNRDARSIDAAIASRITVMLGYPPLDVEGRAKVWKNLIELVPLLDSAREEKLTKNPRKVSRYRVAFSDADYLELASGSQLNGRQIKNSIVLARALARERGMPLSISILNRAVIAVVGESAD
ncbi:hypothetical protein FisN_32Lh021 [Fistulifera solaris]|uniref:AAA+ ATPase domain-containing protein n=1 Tax=Fistulifera solaris TaxID=1519565 RepID=A0A1Z5KP70_FISSO|nr:hypothetical protein FisN_32Lh021 [Fistulifera solaris]|eukprot:GAX27957.1 hypothetical protein FisN_32Lh021 [Fistulifera solaris]